MGGSRKKLPGEFDLIERLVKPIRLSARTILGPGDDCAILAPSRHPQLVTIDSMVEDVHFRLKWGPPEKLGAKALAVNLSDIAAMGGTPTACVINLAIRPGLDARFFERLYRGIRTAARRYDTDLVGGNVTSGERLAITIALFGDASREVTRRDLARVGDGIFVTGTVGDSSAGLAILSGKLHARGEARKFLIERHLNPTARIEAGRALSKIRPTPAAIDISDGLLQDLGHILERSSVGAEIDAAAIPVSPAYRATRGDDLTLALGGGEDYELLFCACADLAERELTRTLGVPVRRIGRIIKGRRTVIRGTRGMIVAKLRGWDQLRARGWGGLS
jgi:thiamine-monophosphate kinase